MTEKVDGLRWKIEEIDNAILDMIKKRMEAALSMGQTKVEKSLDVRNLRVEDEVVSRYLSRAEELGISQEAAAEIAQILIRESVEAQARLPRPMKKRKKVLIVGGGKMGLWFARYMVMRGHEVQVFSHRPVTEFPVATDLKKAAKKADVIVLAVKISQCEDVLRQIIACRPPGLVFDIMSVKAPVTAALLEAAEEGISICSVHPMFGPDALSMYSRNIIVCDCGSQRGIDEFLPLIEGMGAKVTIIPLAAHDELIAYVLGLSHAVNIAFFHTLRSSGIDYKTFQEIASTTFKRQSTTSLRVSRESPHLYYEIQHENPYTERYMDLFEKVVRELRHAALDKDEANFIKIMKEGREYFGED